MEMTVEAALPLMRESGKIAVIAHILPDGDTIGSCLALADVLQEAGKSVSLFCEDTPPATLRFLQGWEEFRKENDRPEPFDLAIAVDCSDRERMGACSAVFGNGRRTMNIDHHISNTFYADVNIVDPKASATGEILYRIAVRLAEKIGRHTAEALYTAISTDSGGFSFGSTTSDTHRIVASLLDCGVRVEEVNTCLYHSHRVGRIRLLARALQSLTFYGNGRIALMCITREDLVAAGAEDSDTENIVNYAKDIAGVELGIFLREMQDGTTKASFRSRDLVDVNALAGQFGGGGHRKAAGAVIHAAPEAAGDKILTAAQTMYKELKPDWTE